MSADKSQETAHFHWVRSPNYGTRKVEDVLVEKNSEGGAFLIFYDVRPAMERKFEYEVLGTGDLGEAVKIQGEHGTIMEMHHGIILDAEALRSLRDQLNEALEEEPS